MTHFGWVRSSHAVQRSSQRTFQLVGLSKTWTCITSVLACTKLPGYILKCHTFEFCMFLPVPLTHSCFQMSLCQVTRLGTGQALRHRWRIHHPTVVVVSKSSFWDQNSASKSKHFCETTNILHLCFAAKWKVIKLPNRTSSGVFMLSVVFYPFCEWLHF